MASLSNDAHGNGFAPRIVEQRLGITLIKMQRKILLFNNLPYFRFGNDSVCTYCGDPATERDHVIPVIFQHNHDQQRGTINGPITYACHRCNCSLGSHWFDTFSERCRWLSDRIVDGGVTVTWHGWEMAWLDHTLRSYVKKRRNYRKWQAERADWYESRDYWLNIENLQWELQIHSASNPFLKNYFALTLRNLKQRLYKVE